MRKRSLSWLVALGFIFLVVGAGMILRFWKYIIYLPPLWERLVALPAESPGIAYEKFQNELLKGNDQKSLRFITRETRDKYRELLRDPEIRKHYVSPLNNLTELYQADCEDQRVCRVMSVYTYDYEVTEAYWENILGKDFLIPAGKRKLEMTFVEIKKGYWQINEF